MLRFLAALTASLALMVSASSVTRADSHAFCSDPDEDRPFTCGTVFVMLADGADLDEVLARSAPHAEAGPQNADDGAWIVYVNEGDEVFTRDALAADADVEEAYLSEAPEGYNVGDDSLRDAGGSGETVPDTAMAGPTIAGPSALVALLLLLGTLTAAWRPRQ